MRQPQAPLLPLMMASYLAVAVLATFAGADVPRASGRDQKSSNRLVHETSPYLLMHAHNPVDWYPWGTEAFTRAKKENKLVFLSIGYSSCYWCHVMERESFENPDVAKLLNNWFISIKVDREERPDIDSAYMAALAICGQKGGWPLSMFLMPDGKPIIGGTYWPREDQQEEGVTRPGFKAILTFMHKWYAKKPDEIRARADGIAELTANSLAGTTRGIPLVDLHRDLVAGAVNAIREDFDNKFGGFGSSSREFSGPKFPVPCNLELLLAEIQRTKSAELTRMLTLTLDRMAQGGIYDQLGGGFHRYSTERTWTVPHFEKMLYDNAQLVEVYSKAFRLTGKPLYERIVRDTLAFIRREMTSPEGVFYSALDAETNGEEGRFYVWSGKEIDNALGNPDDAALVKRFYGADAGTNFEEHYHIFVASSSVAEMAKSLKVPEQQLESRIAVLREKLFNSRVTRPRPFLDTKALTCWNGQMIAAYAVAGNILHEPAYIEGATRAADFILSHLQTSDHRLLRTYSAQPGKSPEAKLNAYLDDYADLVHGLLCLHDVTNDKKWLTESQVLTASMVRWYEDRNAGGFFLTSNDHEKLFARSKEQYDSAQPSGNSVAAGNLVRLWIKTGDKSYRSLAENTFKALAGSMKSNPSTLTELAANLDSFLDADEKNQPAASLEKIAQLPGGGAKKSDGVAKVTVAGDKPDSDGNQTVTVSIAIDPTWHLYANPVPKDFPGIPTTVTFNAKTKPEDVKIDYPKGKLIKDALAGDYYVYEGKVSIKAALHRAKGDESPLEVQVKVQACNENKCLLPATVKLTVP